MLLDLDVSLQIAPACLLALLQLSDAQVHLRERSRLLAKAESQPTPVLSSMETENLLRSLHEPVRYWEFLIAPDTPYLERWTAAIHARELLPLEWLPRLLDARRELESEQRSHGFGVCGDPRSAQQVSVPGPCDGVPRVQTILGATWTIPARSVDFPATWEEVCRAPWPWQVQKVLSQAYDSFRPRGSESGDDLEWSKRWLDECLKLPWGSDDAARVFVDTSAESRRVNSLPVLARWRAIALDPGFPDGARAVVRGIVDTARLWNDPRSQDLVAAIAVDIVRECPSMQARGELIWALPRSERRPPNPKEATEPSLIRVGGPAATLLLAAARLASDERTGSAWERYYLYASPCCECLVSPPFTPDGQMSPESPAVAAELQRFADWLRVHEGELDAAARAEAPRLDAARETLLAAASEPK